MEYFTFGAEQEDVGTRIDVFLADAMENLSRSGVQKLIEEGHITLNGGRTKANYKLRERDIIDQCAARMSGSRMHHHPLRLIHHDDIRILI